MTTDIVDHLKNLTEVPNIKKQVTIKRGTWQ